MIKINLNELRKNNIFTCSDYYCDSTDYFPSYYCGFIESIFIEDGHILLNVFGYGLQGKLKHDKLKINIKDITKFESNNEILEIETYKKYDDYDYETDKIIGEVISSSKFRFFKNNNFRFIMREFYEVIPSCFICDLEAKLLMNESILKVVDMPEDYEFGEY